MTDQVIIDIGESDKAIQILEAADKELRAIQFISKEMALEFSGAAMRAVRMALDVNQVEKGKDTMDQIEAMRKYVRAKWQEGNSNIYAYNTIAKTKIRICQALGDWLRDHYPASASGGNHGGGRPTKTVDEPTSSTVSEEGDDWDD